MKLVVSLLVALSACGRSPCQTYAQMEVTCNSVPENERERDLTVARGMCEAARSDDPSEAAAGARFAKEAECAAQTDDCAAYLKCRTAADSTR